jgi:hypothetical protein
MNKVMNRQKMASWLMVMSQHRKLWWKRCKRVLYYVDQTLGCICAGLIIIAVIAAAYWVTELFRILLGAAMAF